MLKFVDPFNVFPLDEAKCVNATELNGNYTGCCMLGKRMQNEEIHYNCTFNETIKKYTCPMDRYGKRYGICS